jgi:hypothetical protein
MTIGKQFQALKATVYWAYVPTLVVLGVVMGYALATGRRVWYFTNDPFTLGHLPFYAGVLSSLANVLWGAGATVCFFSAMVLGKTGEGGRGRREDGREKMGDGSISSSPNTQHPTACTLFQFLLASGLLTALFLFDDLFQFHRILYIKYLPLSAEAVFALYGLVALIYLIYFRKEIAGTDYLLLGVALALFAAAVILDTVSLLSRGRTAFSDALKFLGIVTWVAYFARTGRQMLRQGFNGAAKV